MTLNVTAEVLPSGVSGAQSLCCLTCPHRPVSNDLTVRTQQWFVGGPQAALLCVDPCVHPPPHPQNTDSYPGSGQGLAIFLRAWPGASRMGGALR